MARARILESVSKKWDGWINALTGMGIRGMDARVESQVIWTPLSESQCAHLYAAESMASKIVDKPVDDAISGGYKFTGIDENQVKDLTARLKQLNFDASLSEAWKNARRTGGGGIFKIYADDLDVAAPVANPVPPLKSLITLDRFELRAPWEDVQKDVLSPNFGTPIVYTFSGRAASISGTPELKIHCSRITRFVGAPLPNALRGNTDQWGDSYLNRPQNAIRNYAEAHDSVNAALKDISVAVFKVKGLADMLDANNDESITNRLRAVNLAKSLARAVIVDADGEDFDYRQRNLAGAKDLVTLAGDRLAAETDMPRTILMGESPTGGGLGSGGEHSSENWYGQVATQQVNYLKPKMLEIAKEVCVELKIDSTDLDVEFNALWEMSSKDEATMHFTQAQADQIYYNIGALDPYEIASSRFGSGKFSLETTVDMDAREAQERVLPPEQMNQPPQQLGPGQGDPQKNVTPRQPIPPAGGSNASGRK